MNLLSTESLRQKGVFYRLDRQQLFIAYIDEVDVILVDVYLYNGLPYLVTELPITALNTSKVVYKAEATMLIQYLRLGYIQLRKIIAIVRKGIIKIKGNRYLHCIAYLIAQLHQVYSRIPLVRPTLIYYLVSVDVVLVRQPSLTKDRYFILFTEAKSLERDILFLLYKSAAATNIKIYYRRRKNEGYSIVVYRLDGGKEYSSNTLL